MKKRSDVTRITLRVPTSLYIQMTQCAEKDYQTLNDFIIDCIVNGIRFTEHAEDFFVAGLQKWLLSDVGTEWARRYVAGIVEDMVEERTREEVMSIFEGFHKMQKVEELLKKYLQELPEK